MFVPCSVSRCLRIFTSHLRTSHQPWAWGHRVQPLELGSPHALICIHDERRRGTPNSSLPPSQELQEEGLELGVQVEAVRSLIQGNPTHQHKVDQLSADCRALQRSLEVRDRGRPVRGQTPGPGVRPAFLSQRFLCFPSPSPPSCAQGTTVYATRRSGPWGGRQHAQAPKTPALPGLPFPWWLDSESAACEHMDTSTCARGQRTQRAAGSPEAQRPGGREPRLQCPLVASPCSWRRGGIGCLSRRDVN